MKEYGSSQNTNSMQSKSGFFAVSSLKNSAKRSEVPNYEGGEGLGVIQSRDQISSFLALGNKKNI